MNQDELKNLWMSEERQAFSGWDFSYLDGRWSAESLPWDYKKIVCDALIPSQKLLDMGTGGGEFLLGLDHPHENTCVTEAWPPNVRLCRERLAPLGIRVFQVQDDTRLPFEDDAFDIVINRHAAYDISEVARLLKPGGLFITQQVGSENNRTLAERLNHRAGRVLSSFSLKTEVPKLRSRGFELTSTGEALTKSCFYDVGAIVYFAKIIPWEFPDFSVESNFPQLCALQEELLDKGYIASREHRFIIGARKLS